MIFARSKDPKHIRQAAMLSQLTLYPWGKDQVFAELPRSYTARYMIGLALRDAGLEVEESGDKRQPKAADVYVRAQSGKDTASFVIPGITEDKGLMDEPVELVFNKAGLAKLLGYGVTNPMLRVLAEELKIRAHKATTDREL